MLNEQIVSHYDVCPYKYKKRRILNSIKDYLFLSLYVDDKFPINKITIDDNENIEDYSKSFKFEINIFIF